ncbi:MAG TPA: CCA tRNA nucleotidyltransferase [Aliiroseovarius sp.]|nr:CCA tRNA nucleotidyltransferase [Aliiroseovarius sp.]
MQQQIDAQWLRDPQVQAVCTMLTAAGHQALFVGGCVRNTLIGAPVSDIDIATSALPAQVIDLAGAAGMKAVPTGIGHGTITVVSGGQSFEVTTFRRDVETHGRRAVVAFSTNVTEDAARRDFTMNALYATPAGKVLDPLGQGLEDLAARRVRFIGDAGERIREDFLRILRYFRFHAWYGDSVAGLDPQALAAIADNLAGLETLSRERVGQEVLKLMAAPDPAPAAAAMQQVGALAALLPGADAHGLGPLVHLEAETGTGPGPIRRLAALGRIANAQALLRLSRRDAKRLSLLLELVENMAGLAEMAYRHGADIARDAMLLRAALTGAPVPEGWRDAVAKGAEARFPVTARDLAPLSGQALGTRLKALEARWIASGFLLTRAELLA